MTKEEAKRLSIKKWEIIIKNDGKFTDEVFDDTELHELHHFCGYCHYFNYNKETPYKCYGCPLDLRTDPMPYELACSRIDHPFYAWADSKTKENAQKVLDLIKNS